MTAALRFFVLDGFVTEHILLLQEQSALYKYLCFFEEDLSRRRFDMPPNGRSVPSSLTARAARCTSAASTCWSR
jgi:hypothetical protein